MLIMNMRNSNNKISLIKVVEWILATFLLTILLLDMLKIKVLDTTYMAFLVCVLAALEANEHSYKKKRK